MSTKTEARPTCTHSRDVVIVTNQPDRFDRRRVLASIWVCGSRACVLDALDHVAQSTGELAYWRIGPNHEGHTWQTVSPREDVTR